MKKKSPSLKLFIPISIVLILALVLALLTRTTKAQLSLTRNYRVGCALGVIDGDLCPLLPRIVEAVENARYEDILDLQEERDGPSCDLGCPGGHCVNRCLKGETPYPAKGHVFGYVGSANFFLEKNYFIEEVTKILAQEEYYFYGIKRWSKEVWIIFSDREQNEAIILGAIKDEKDWKVQLFAPGKFDHVSIYL